MSATGSMAPTVAGLEIRVAGQAVDPLLAAQVLEVRLESHLLLADTVSIRIADPQLEYIDAGTFDIGDDFAGKITATAVDSNAAAKLADVFRGFIALGQMSGDQNPELKQLLNTLTVTQNAAQLSVSITIPGDLIGKLGRGKVRAPGAI